MASGAGEERSQVRLRLRVLRRVSRWPSQEIGEDRQKPHPVAEGDEGTRTRNRHGLCQVKRPSSSQLLWHDLITPGFTIAPTAWFRTTLPNTPSGQTRTYIAERLASRADVRFVGN